MEIGYNVSDVKERMEQIEQELVMMLEINISNGIFIENGVPITIDGKTISYPKVQSEIPDKYSINYDPFNNRKIAHFLFIKYAIVRMKEDPSFRINSFFISKYINNPNMLYATCRTNRGDFVSHAFTNESVCWIDLIYIMDNYQIEDMGLFDSQINLERSLQQSIKGVKKK